RARGSSNELPWPCALQNHAILVKLDDQFRRVVVTRYYSRIFRLFGGNARGGLVAVKLAQVDGAGATEKRGEVRRLAPEFQHLGVKLREEGGGRQPLARGDLVENAPEGALQPDRGALAVEPEPAGLGLVAAGLLAGKDLAHGPPSQA